MTTTSSAAELAAPLGSVDLGRLVFVRGAAHLTIGVDASMEDLYRARFEGKMPDVWVDGGTVTVRYRPSFRPTRGEITLSGRVPWAIKARMGMSDVVADLQDLELTGLEISGGVSRLEVKLPRPKAAVPVRIGAGASNVELIRPAGVPVRVRIGGGASKLAIDDLHLGPPGGRPTGGAPTTTWSRAATTSRSVPEPARSPSEPDSTAAGAAGADGQRGHPPGRLRVTPRSTRPRHQRRLRVPGTRSPPTASAVEQSSLISMKVRSSRTGPVTAVQSCRRCAQRLGRRGRPPLACLFSGA